jgi:hypothetical protein
VKSKHFLRALLIRRRCGHVEKVQTNERRRTFRFLCRRAEPSLALNATLTSRRRFRRSRENVCQSRLIDLFFKKSKSNLDPEFGSIESVHLPTNHCETDPNRRTWRLTKNLLINTKRSLQITSEGCGVALFNQHRLLK